MFKKFKDKLAEEVKSSPQRIQQFAQAAQAAVTSASSSISDITNNDLFSIGDNDNVTKPQTSSYNITNENNHQIGNNISDIQEFSMDLEDRHRQRRLSNSSLASDISFRLPNYESPSMYHLQSDMEVSASEAEEKGFISGSVNLNRVTKDQLYAAYRRSQDKFKKYKSQYSDLARHYKLLERENAKARNVLVETQDKALRRISELKEQCSLEQSAKAHLEKALRVEIEEKNLKIDALNTQLKALSDDNNSFLKKEIKEDNSQMQLINLNDDNEAKENESSEVTLLHNKLEKLEQLLNKYKESLKATKEKNSNLTTEVQKLKMELDVKTKENMELQKSNEKINKSMQQVQELTDKLENLENLKNSIEFSKTKEISILEGNLKSCQEEVVELKEKIKVLSKREEEYAISLAENKLSIHKELESKEAEIKSLKNSLATSHNEIDSLKSILKDHKDEKIKLEKECLKLNEDLKMVTDGKMKLEELAKEIESLNEKKKNVEAMKLKCEEDINCLNLQLKQETAEKLSVIDRNAYLESRNAQLTDENTKKRSQISKLEEEVLLLKNNVDDLKQNLNYHESNNLESNLLRLTEEATAWKLKCSSLESEIQEEREELVKLQEEIEKLLLNHEILQKQNIDLNDKLKICEADKERFCIELKKYKSIGSKLFNLKEGLTQVRYITNQLSTETKSMNNKVIQNWFLEIKEGFRKYRTITQDEVNHLKQSMALLKEQSSKVLCDYEKLSKDFTILKTENNNLILTLNEKRSECASLTKTIEDLSTSNSSLQKDNKDMNDTIIFLNQSIDSLKDDLVKSHQMLQSNKEQLNLFMEKNSEIINVKNENEKRLNYVTELEQNLKTLKQHNAELLLLKQDVEKNQEQLQLEFNTLLKTHTDTENNFKALKDENKNMIKTCDDVFNKNSALESELHEMKKNISVLESKLDLIQNEKKELLISRNEAEVKYTEIQTELNHIRTDLENKLKILNEENNYLKTSNNSMANKLKETELKLTEVFKNYSDVQREKSVIEQNVAELESKVTSQNIVIEDQAKTISINNKFCECESLKEDKRRLGSDIEGLQTYLSKISKENSELNDKLRELIASSETPTEQEDHLRAEVQINKEKIDALLRENSILIEENLELKDQINSQINSGSIPTNSKPTDCENVDTSEIKEQYQKLLQTKKNLELKVNELEQMNISLNKSIDQNQDNYERLKISNEKLQRKLDEALVSLRHLHALEENTELEYLRNILYEYLTGSGTHSITLAKVLAAVVKFDDRQTEQVLLKEKERQGILHHLGII